MFSSCSLKNTHESDSVGSSPSQAPKEFFTPSISSETSFDDDLVQPEGYTHDWSKISMVTEFAEYPVDVSEINVVIINQDIYIFSYDVDIFTLECYDGDLWEQVAFSDGGDYGIDLAGIIHPGQSVTFTANIENRFELPLTPGRYRIVKKQLIAEFTVTNS
jgi:hypothetical protein